VHAKASPDEEAMAFIAEHNLPAAAAVPISARIKQAKEMALKGTGNSG